MAVGLFSGVVNVLALTGSIYMLQIYDRVMPSHSVPTLVGLTLVMLLLYAVLRPFRHAARAHAEPHRPAARAQPARAGVRGDAAAAAARRTGGDGLQPVRDLDQIRGFLSGQGPTALFDLPWMPFYLGLVFLLHPWLGGLGVAGALVLIALTILTEARSRKPGRDATETGAARHTLGEAARRNAEVMYALGMGEPRVAALLGACSERAPRRSRSAQPTSSAPTAPCRRSCAWCCSRRCSGSAPIW